MVTSSKISGTGSTPTGSRNVTSIAKDDVVGSPCSVSKIVPKSRRKRENDAVDNSLTKKKKEGEVIVEQKREREIEEGKKDE